MKYYNTPYDEVMKMPANRFFLLLDEIKRIEKTDDVAATTPKEKLKTMDTPEDFYSFFL